MKIIRIILKITGSLVSIIVISFIGLNIYVSIDKVDTFYVQDSKFMNYQYLLWLDQQLVREKSYSALRDEVSAYVHRIAKGSGTVFGYRSYTNGTMAIDDEGFEKLTVWVSEFPSKLPLDIGLEGGGVRAAYTTGGSAWPRAACSGYLVDGSVSFEKSGSSIKIAIDAVFKPAGSRALGDYCKEKSFDHEFTASKIEFSSLTPWLGLKGDHPYAETYR